MSGLLKVALVALAGATGALARWTLASAVGRMAPADFAYGTLVVNVVGCVLAGIVWALAEERLVIPVDVRTVLLVGFLGSFTTFSAYALETGVMLDNGRWLGAAANVAAQNVVGLAALFAGLGLGRAV